ncbi:Hypothetical predicted protein [Mytilus galloprovincialis]|uniref:Uncharacterized protein n=2 Tax=Mytilus TaxID=6548 RepID=A0A8B6CSZ7_MYTGA|nr:Hypothetical predicted protein [Mytilus galloprovincialis]VDI15543.1 Hypothetical predicted protein [Mytilus galloprovincialis]
MGVSIGGVLFLMTIAIILMMVAMYTRRRRQRRRGFKSSSSSDADTPYGIGLKYHPFQADTYAGGPEYYNRMFMHGAGPWSEAEYPNQAYMMKDFQIKRPQVDVGYNTS